MHSSKLADSMLGPAPEAGRPANVVNGLIHLYRGEMGRLTTYRVRLDTTTSWAITSSALIGTFVLGNGAMPHVALLFLMLILLFFLLVEARRFRVYEVSRLRVQLLERYFYPELLGAAVDPTWTRMLVEALEQPGVGVNRVGAVGWRLRRNYLWIYLIVLACWLGKLQVSGPSIGSLSDLARRADVGAVAGELVLLLVLLGYAALLLVAALARRVYPLGDDLAQARELMEATPGA
jgi:uncharacterized membrane protein